MLDFWLNTTEAADDALVLLGRGALLFLAILEIGDQAANFFVEDVGHGCSAEAQSLNVLSIHACNILTNVIHMFKAVLCLQVKCSLEKKLAEHVQAPPFELVSFYHRHST